MKIVKVVWVDAVLNCCEMPFDRAVAQEPVKREDVGYCLHEDKKKMVLTFGFIEHETKMYDHVFVIPRCMILDIKELNDSYLLPKA